MIVCPLLFSVVVVIVLSKDTVYASLFGFVISKDFDKDNIEVTRKKALNIIKISLKCVRFYVLISFII